MSRFSLFFFLLISGSVSAQEFAFELWHEGRVVLETADTLKGQVKYNMQDDVVQVKYNNRYETYTARKVLFFEIFDSSVKKYRQFFSLPYAFTGQYKAPIFFELLEEGKITLVSREVLEVRTYSPSPYYVGANYSRQVLVDKFFYLKDDGTIQPINGKKSDFLDLMGTRSDEVQKFSKQNKLDFDQKYDVARAVNYYNSFFKK